MNSIQIKLAGKILAGALLIFATGFAISTILAYFPNKMPAPGKGEDAWYRDIRFKMTLIEQNDTTEKTRTEYNAILGQLKKRKDMLTVAIKAKQSKSLQDSTYGRQSDSLKSVTDSITDIENLLKQLGEKKNDDAIEHNNIHLNTILLILVASMGFLGNMVHIASSFTSFVGNGTFENRWILWYFVKPFTAAGLAVVIYFVIRAGFMGYGSDASSVNLYGILALSALAGLFTDNAALKLKEVFDVIFKPKDERSDKLDDFKLKVASVSPPVIDVNNANSISIKGENFNKKKITVKINGKVISKPTITADSVDFIYIVDAAERQKTEFDLLLADEAGKVFYKTTIKTN